MTFQDALAQRLPRIRLPLWSNPDAYLRLPLLADGMHGPWVELYDARGQEACDIPVGTQRLLTFSLEADGRSDYEPYLGTPSPCEQEEGRYARVYLET